MALFKDSNRPGNLAGAFTAAAAIIPAEDIAEKLRASNKSIFDRIFSAPQTTYTAEKTQLQKAAPLLIILLAGLLLYLIYKRSKKQ
jgi:hypothetical protein